MQTGFQSLDGDWNPAIITLVYSTPTIDIEPLLSNTYWAKLRSKDAIKTSIENSLCFGIYKDSIQIGFARCVTDYSVMYWLADVILDENYRGQGLGKSLIKFITEHELLKNLVGLLGTKDAHGLYKQYGFYNDNGTSMRRNPIRRSIMG